MIRLSAFADEISPNLDEQVAVLQREGIGYMDLRGVWNINVLNLTDDHIRKIQETLDAQGMGVAAIGSPLGKVPIDSAFEADLQRLERAIEIAHMFQTPFIRIFSFYPPTTTNGVSHDPGAYREEVLRRLQAMIERASTGGITLLHENEKDIYGDTIARCVDILRQCSSAHFRAAFDPANFIQCGQVPYPDAYEALRPWIAYVHVKDALADGSVVAAGEGVGSWPELLERLHADGYDGFLSLEPHLAAARQFGGFTGAELFHHAAQALRGMLEKMGWGYQ